MFGLYFRFLWRLLILVVAGAAAYYTAFWLYPWVDDRLPAFFAVLIVYAAVAYAGLPILRRAWQIFIKPNHLPVYVTTNDGWSSDPINIAVICSDSEHLIRAMSAAGWQVADRATLTNLIKMSWAIVLNKPYPTAPFSSLYLFGRRQDIGFQLQEGNPPTPRHRHHVRFWQIHDSTSNDHTHGFWRKLLERFLGGKKQIWVGAATHDVGPFALRMRNLQITHQIDENTDTEREFLITSLKKAKRVAGIDSADSGHDLTFRGQTFGVQIVVDGQLKIIKLK